MGTFLALALVVMFSLGAPLFVVIAAAALGFFCLAEVDLSVVVIEMYRLATSPMLITLAIIVLFPNLSLVLLK
jgi:C4-dicarboxylate transporter DctM subunit